MKEGTLSADWFSQTLDREHTGEVGDGVGDVVVGHGEDGQLRDAALAPLYAPRALVYRRQIRVHVA